MNFRSCLVTTSATHSHVGKHQEDSACNTVYMTLLNGVKIRKTIQLYENKQSEQFPAQTAVWWEKVDSNHRSMTQQIYSLPPLATREFSHIWSWWTDLNPRPADYKSAALPTELYQHTVSSNIIPNGVVFVNQKLAVKNDKK